MFFKKQSKNKRVVCPISVIIEIIQETIDIDAGMSEFIISFENKRHKVGFTSDYDRRQGFFDPVFYLDDQEFYTFERFKKEAVLEGRLFVLRADEVEVIEADYGTTKFPWYTRLEPYVTD